VLLCAAAVVFVSQMTSMAVILARTGFDWRVGPLEVRVHSTARALQASVFAAGVILACSRRARAFVRGVPASAVAFYTGALILAFWLSLGPIVTTRGVRVSGDGLYWWLYHYVPGFDGLRVPARMGMIAAMALAVLGGYGARVIERSCRRSGLVLAAAGLLFLVEASAVPVTVNGTWSVGDLAPAPVPLFGAGGPPAVYRAVRALPPRAVLAEFPFGEEQYELRYMVCSAVHWRPLLNGYSGGFPRSYAANRAALGRVLDEPEAAWRALAVSGATHAIVHEGIYLGRGARVSEWLRAHGARELGLFGEDRLFELSPPRVARIRHTLQEM
jgi:hypothetical protein